MIGTQVLILKTHSERDDNINICETILVIILGMIMQNMVDVLSVLRDYLALYYFVLGICLVYLNEIDKQGFEI